MGDVTMSYTNTITVAGMTCAHCVNAVTRELSALPGVTMVDVELRAGAITPVTISSETELDPAAVAGAIDEAGYALASGASGASYTSNG
jgi:copper chaperone